MNADTVGIYFKSGGNMKRVLVILFILLTRILFAGWQLTDEDNTETLISNNVVKNTWEDGGLIMYGNTGELIMFNSEQQVYAKGKVDDFCNAIDQAMKDMMAQMSEEQRQMMKEMMGEDTAESGDVVIKSEGGGDSIDGYSTRIYTVHVDGELYEKIWILTNPQLSKDIEALTEFIKTFISCGEIFGSPNAVESTDAYLELYEKGMIVRSLSYEYGEAETDINILSVKQRNVSPAEMAVPEGFQKISFIEFMKIGMMMPE